MPRISPAIVISLAALFVALSGTGMAGIGAKQRTVHVLGPTQVYVHSFPLETPSGYVACPKGYQALGGGYASYQWPHYQVQLATPSRQVSDYRDSSEGANSAADSWLIAAERTQPGGPNPAPLKGVVICSKLMRIKLQS